MATGSTIGALRVVLGADSAAFDKGLKGASKELQAFQRRVEKIGAVIGAALGTAVIGLAVGIKRAIDEADKLGKAAQSIGVAVEELSKLKHAADLSGVSFESLSKGLARLNRNIVEGAQGLQTPIRAFETLGIQIRNSEGSLKTVGELLPELANKFASMRDGPEKTAIAMQLLGRAGAEMIPLLNAGEAGLRAMMEEAEQLGLVIDGKTSKAAEVFNDNLTRLSRVMTGITTQIAAGLAPEMATLTTRMVEWAKQSGIVETASQSILTVIRAVVTEIAAFIIHVRQIGAELKALGQIVFAQNWAQMKAGLAEWNAVGADTEAQLAGMKLALENFRIESNKLAEEMANAPAGGGAPPIVNKMAQIKAATGAAADEARRWKDEMRAALDEVIDSPTETFVAKMRAVTKAVNEGTISFRQYGKTVRMIQQENMGHMTDLASATASALTTIFKDNKAAAIAAAIINTAVGITKAMQLPPPFSWAQAALVAATGAAQIAAIKSTSQSGGGGAAPSARGGEAAAPAAAAPSQSLVVQGISPGDIFSGDAVRALAERLLKFQKDGGKVVFA